MIDSAVWTAVLLIVALLWLPTIVLASRLIDRRDRYRQRGQ